MLDEQAAQFRAQWFAASLASPLSPPLSHRTFCTFRYVYYTATVRVNQPFFRFSSIIEKEIIDEVHLILASQDSGRFPLHADE